MRGALGQGNEGRRQMTGHRRQETGNGLGQETGDGRQKILMRAG